MTQHREHVPTKERIADYWDMPVDACWACGWPRRVERAHIVPHQLNGSDSDTANYVLLCHHCHAQAPSVTDPEEMWNWLESELELWASTIACAVQNSKSVADAPFELIDTTIGAVLREHVGTHAGGISRASLAWAIPRALERLPN